MPAGRSHLENTGKEERWSEGGWRGGAGKDKIDRGKVKM